MAETTGIHAAMIGILSEIGAIDKAQWNTGQKYAFRGIDQFMNTLHPLLVKHRVFITPNVEHVERSMGTSKNGSVMFSTLLTVRYTFHAEDGSTIDVVSVGEGADSSDKATNKASSAAFKYAVMQAFCIPTEEMIDGDAENPEMIAEVVAANNKPTRTDRKANFHALTDYLTEEEIPSGDAEDYCIAKGMLETGETLANLTDAKLRGIVKRLDDFGAAVREFAEATTPKEGAE